MSVEFILMFVLFYFGKNEKKKQVEKKQSVLNIRNHYQIKIFHGQYKLFCKFYNKESPERYKHNARDNKKV